MRKRICLFLSMFVAMLLLVSCSSEQKYIKEVKNGHFEQFPDITIGEAFSKNFKQGKWSYYDSVNTDTKKYKQVRYEGIYNVDGESKTVKFEFYIDLDTNTVVLNQATFSGGNPLDLLSMAMGGSIDDSNSNYQVTDNNNGQVENIQQIQESEIVQEYDSNSSDIYYMVQPPTWNASYMISYVNSSSADLSDIWEILNNFQELYQKLDFSKGNYIEESTPFWSKDYYAITIKETNLFYVGELKDNKPDGFGMLEDIIEFYNSDTGENEYYNHVKYLGYFKNGRPYGQCIKYKALPDTKDIENMLKNTEMRQEFIDSYLSPIQYVGGFKDGVYSGKGVLFDYIDVTLAFELLKNSNSADTYYDDYEDNESAGYEEDAGTDEYEQFLNETKDSIKNIDFSYGTYESGKMNGYVEIYHNQKLLYAGNTLYDTNGRIKYEGEFTADKYDGNGTLYDENGNVVYSGKWDMGDYGH